MDSEWVNQVEGVCMSLERRWRGLSVQFADLWTTVIMRPLVISYLDNRPPGIEKDKCEWLTTSGAGYANPFADVRTNIQ